MDLNDLSSNWRKLQATLKGDISNPPKRKASVDVLQPQQNGVKRIRNDLSATCRKSKLKSRGPRNTLKAPKMGVTPSKQPQSITRSTASLSLWAEDNVGGAREMFSGFDIPVKDLAEAYGTSVKLTSDSSLPDIKHNDEIINEGLSTTSEPGKYVAVDCEMVGVGPKPDNESALARVSIVNYYGHQLYDSFVSPKEPVTDYRTHVSGVTPELLRSARSLEAVQADVAKLLDGRILIGHSVRNDLDALLLGHPKRDIRDTSRYPGFRHYAGGRTPGLKKLAKEVLGIDIQSGEHSSVEDAQVTMLLFRREKAGFECEHAKRWGPSQISQTGAKLTNKKSKN